MKGDCRPGRLELEEEMDDCRGLGVGGRIVGIVGLTFFLRPWSISTRTFHRGSVGRKERVTHETPTSRADFVGEGVD